MIHNKGNKDNEIQTKIPDPKTAGKAMSKPRKSNRKPIINELLYKMQKMCFAGQPKVGKSFLLLNLIRCLVLGQEWLGFQCTQSRVLYINLEIAEEDLSDRLQDLVGDGDKKTWSKYLDIWNLRGFTVSIEDIYERLFSWCEHHSYDVIVIDPIYKCFNGDENNANDVAKFMAVIDKIMYALHCSVILVHHFNKAGNADMNSFAGSNVFLRDADAILMLTKSGNSDIRILKGVFRNYGNFSDVMLTFAAPFFKIPGKSDTPALPEAHDPQKPVPSKSKKFEKTDFDKAFGEVAVDGKVKTSDLANALDCSYKTVERRLNDQEYKDYHLEKGFVTKS